MNICYYFLLNIRFKVAVSTVRAIKEIKCARIGKEETKILFEENKIPYLENSKEFAYKLLELVRENNRFL